MTRMKLGENIKKARKEAGLSQLDLGKACGWDDAQSRISNYERDVRAPSYKDLQKIADVLGRDVMEFFKGVSDTPTARIFRKLQDLNPEHQKQVESIVDAFFAADQGKTQ